jgi:hypothetical protein
MSENTNMAEMLCGKGRNGLLSALYYQNKEIIEQNEKIIKLLTDIRGLS